MTRAATTLSGVLMLLSACSNQTVVTPPAVPGEISGQDITGIIERIKQDISFFYSDQNPIKPTQTISNNANKCNIPIIDIEINKITVKITANKTISKNGKIGLSIPFGPASAFKIGPGIEVNSSTGQTSVLTFDLFPPKDRKFVLPDQLSIAPMDEKNPTDRLYSASTDASIKRVSGPPPRVTPLSDSLIALREAFQTAATTRPCLASVPPPKIESKDTLEVSFDVKSDSNPNIGFNIAIVEAKVGAKLSDSNANTITISFAPKPKK